MKRAIAGLVVVMIWLSVAVVYAGENLKPQELNAAIQAAGAQWHAGETPQSVMSEQQRKNLLGVIMPDLGNVNKAKYEPFLVGDTPPTSLDWRNNNGNWITSVKDQGNCGSCWAFSTTATLESYTLIANNPRGGDGTTTGDNKTPVLDLSEQVLVSCSGAGSCNGGYMNTVADYVQGTGTPAESCYPYTATNGSCSSACSTSKSAAYKINSWQSISADVNSMKDALNRYGPLVTTMYVYNDFFSYYGGIYKHVTGSGAGWHAIELIGYNDAQQYFIAKNSWTTSWGENGFFRISYSEVGGPSYFGYYTQAYNNVPMAPRPLAPTGTTSTTTPAYSWGAVYGSTYYMLYVNDSTGNKISTTYTSSEVACSTGTGTCTITPSTALAPGTASWWVAGYNTYGWGRWTEGNSFTVPGSNSVPSAPTLVSPTGSTSTTTPTYTWNAVSGASNYQLYVNDSTGNKISTIYSAATLGCSGGSGTCSVTPTTTLASGSANWWVAAWNTAGWGNWSNSMSFTVPGTNSVPSAPTLISPTGSITTKNPAYKWNAVSGASYYQLYVNDSTGNKISTVYSATEAGCGGGTGTCSITPTTALATGSGSWYAAAWNTAGWSSWSSAMSFTVN